MSEIEHISGKLTPVLILDTLELTAKRILEANSIELHNYYDSCLEQLSEQLYEKYLVISGELYGVADFEPVDDDEEIYNASYNEDGTINFEVKFYNGGCSLNEAIELGLERHKIEHKVQNER